MWMIVKTIYFKNSLYLLKFKSDQNNFELFQNVNEVDIIPFDLIVRPLRLLSAIRFNYLRQHNLSVWDVQLHATFYQNQEELEKARSEGEYGFKKLILLGAKWDYEQ